MNLKLKAGILLGISLSSFAFFLSNGVVNAGKHGEHDSKLKSSVAANRGESGGKRRRIKTGDTRFGGVTMPARILIDAAARGNLRMVKRLVSGGVSPNIIDDWIGETPLRQASRNGHVEVVRYLLSRGANVNSQDAWGWTALYKAVEKGHENVVDALLREEDIEVNLQDMDGDTALHCAAEGYNFDSGVYKRIYEKLLAHGARIDMKNRAGQTPADIVDMRLRSGIASRPLERTDSSESFDWF